MPAWTSSRTFLTQWSPMCAAGRVPVEARAAGDPLRGRSQAASRAGFGAYRRDRVQRALLGGEVPAGDVAGAAQPGCRGGGPGGDPASGVHAEYFLAVGGKRGECSLGGKQVQRLPDGTQVCRLPQPDGAVGAGGQDGPAAWGERYGQDRAGLRDYWAGELPAGCRVERGDAAVIGSRDKAAYPGGESQHLDLAQ